MRITLPDALHFDDRGLVTVVVQSTHGEVLMLAHANHDAIEKTLATGDAHFWSRSRQALWRKGETSGHVLRVRSVHKDCDGDALLYVVEPEIACHTGNRSCFFSEAVGEEWRENALPAAPTLARLDATIAARAKSPDGNSYTRHLLDEGLAAVNGKVQEESGELSMAIAQEARGEVVDPAHSPIHEAADLMFHLLVLLHATGRSLSDLERELARREGKSGLEEKRER